MSWLWLLPVALVAATIGAGAMLVWIMHVVEPFHW